MSEVSSFFSRRRAGLRAEAEAEARAKAAVEDAPLEEIDDVEQAPDLPDPDTMKAGDDFAAFMVKTVSTDLRNRALRQLWRSNPILACVDGLNDYDDDYLAMSKGQGPLKTSYEVGRGLKRHLDYLARDRSEEDEPADEAIDPDDRDAEVRPPADLQAAPADDPDDAPDEPPAPAPRRMRFHSEGRTT